MKALLEQLVVPGKAQTTQQQTEYLFFEEQRPGPPLARIAPFPWESLPSVIARAARQMDGIHPRQFLRPAMNLHHLSEHDLLILTRDEDYAALEYALHIDAKTLYDRTLHRFASLFQRWDRFPVSDTYLSLELNARLPLPRAFSSRPSAFPSRHRGAYHLIWPPHLYSASARRTIFAFWNTSPLNFSASFPSRRS